MMKKSVIIILVSLSLLRPIPAKADLFGGDVIVLTKIHLIKKLRPKQRIITSCKSC